MEAPEKIYLIRNISTPTSLNTTNDCHEKYLQEWYKGREKDTDIEYIRTDVIIERAVQFIKERLNFDDNAWYIEGEVTVKDQVIEDFKDYMKGET